MKWFSWCLAVANESVGVGPTVPRRSGVGTIARLEVPKIIRLSHCFLFGLAMAAGAASAQGYPDKSRPIKIILPSGAASASDLLARAYAKGMAEVAGLNVVVENKPGAETVLGVQSFLASPPDGYTMLVVSSSTLVLNPVMIPNLPYDPLRDLLPLTAISKAGLVMNLGTSTSFKTAREFVAAARANPGKYTCATASTTQRMACELLQATAGIQLLIVPYKTTAAAMLAVGSSETDVIFVDAGTATSLWQTGRVRGVAVTSKDRLSTLAQLPTLREEGITDYNMSAWYAIFFAAGTPPEIAATMRDILRKAAKTKSIAQTLNSFAMEPLDLAGDDVSALNRSEIANWTRLIREQNIKLTN